MTHMARKNCILYVKSSINSLCSKERVELKGALGEIRSIPILYEWRSLPESMYQ